MGAVLEVGGLMAQERKGAVLWKGTPLDVVGPELKVGDQAPSQFSVIDNDLGEVKGESFSGKPRLLLSVLSFDTGVCDKEGRRFNQEAARFPGVKFYAISMDLPFTQKRWCTTSEISRMQVFSDYKERSFGPEYGVYAPSKGLLIRAIFVIGKDDTLRHVEYVKAVANEPNYAAALEAVRTML
jgi:thioredoxin-dependent peroxiredoxin